MEDEFRILYERTARPLRAYLFRVLRDASRADDLLQETYLRYLQAKRPVDMTDEYRKNYLFRIASNLLHDEGKTRKSSPLDEYPGPSDLAGDVQSREDSARYLAQLTPRQRELLWLAYVEKFTHKEIAAILGVGAASIGPMLSRARERFSEILKKGGFKADEP
jgi:RNA polymerase sigma-70 factor (ECF subfamily)